MAIASAESASGRDAIVAVAQLRPDVVVLDLGLPDIEGQEVLLRVREWTLTPIIMLSVHDADRDKISALDAGADDYLTKPFSLNELLARLRVALRHAQPTQSAVFETGALAHGPGSAYSQRARRACSADAN